jgi:hypothetical protein
MSTPALTVVAMLAFAGNSLLCRAALRDGTIDPASFTTLRLAGGALALWLIVRWGAAARQPRLRHRTVRVRDPVLARLCRAVGSDRCAAAVRRGAGHDDRRGSRAR